MRSLNILDRLDELAELSEKFPALDPLAIAIIVAAASLEDEVKNAIDNLRP